jgi:hypothetical protein
MKRYNYIFGAIFFLMFVCFVPMSKAETVSQKQASKIAESFFNAAKGVKLAPPKLVYNGRRLTTDRLFSPFYVYNHPMSGYVIISADNKAFPILGYSLESQFDPNAMTENEKALLTQYAIHIEQIRYDSRVPEDAIAAWNDIPNYIDNMISSQYIGTDLLNNWTEIESTFDLSLEDISDDLFSVLYSPSQWEALIKDNLYSQRNITIGIADKTVVPAVITGYKGDMFEIALSENKHAFFRLFATEYLSEGELALLNSFPIHEVEDETEVPFKFYEDFISEVNNERELERKKIIETLQPSEPKIEFNGSGRFCITLPEDVWLTRVYNVAGALISEQTYKDTNVANVDIFNAPSGFYILIARDVLGNPYGFKIHR